MTRAALLALVLAISGVACSGNDDDSAVPEGTTTTTASTAATSTTAKPASIEDEVTARYLAYWDARLAANEEGAPEAARADARVDVLERSLVRRQPTDGEHFTMRLDGCVHDKRTDAGEQLIARLRGAERRSGDVAIGEVGGFELRIVERTADDVTMALGDVASFTFADVELARSDPVGIVRRLEHAVSSIDDRLATARADGSDAHREAERARARLGRPFDGAEDLRRAERRQSELDELLLEPAGTPKASVRAPRSGGLSLA